MTFAERLKDLRAQSGFSQEKLAEKVGVSRQAITKWETNKGTSDVENLMLLSELFEISLDELLAGGRKRTEPAPKDYLYEGVTEYDISDAKRYNIKIGGAKVVCSTAYDGEKIHVRLASNIITTLQADFKVRVDDTKG